MESVPYWMSGQHRRVMANVCCQVRVELTMSLVRNNSDLEKNFVDPFLCLTLNVKQTYKRNKEKRK